jgi:GT2 family glycosyltransferase
MLTLPFFNVSVIVVNYNCYYTLKACIKSILKSEAVREILLVDNASTDGSMDLIEKCTDDRLKIIRLKQNIGLAAARNLAAARTKCHYFAFTDADVVVDRNWLQGPCSLLEKNKEIGAVQCNIVPCNHLDKVAYAMAGLNGCEFKRIPKERPPSFCSILYPVGAGFVITRDAWNTVKGFDPAFFVGNDDIDLGLRLWVCGYQVIRSSEGIVYHEFGTLRSRREIAPIFQFYGIRNELSLWAKNLERSTLMKQVLPFSLLYPFMAFLVGGVIGIKGLISFLRSLPSILVKRYEIQHLRKISDDNIIPMMHNSGILPIQLFTRNFQVFYKYIFRGTRNMLRKLAIH